jgi:RNA polymerase sigma-70 factor, ECF subfamily
MEHYREKSDNEILALSVNHPSAFAIIVDRYQKEFLRKVIYILKNKEEAEDIVQDAFIKIYMNASKFKLQEGATFKSWGYKILLNTCYTFCKKKKREQQFRDYIELDADLVFVESEFEKKFEIDQIVSVISKLPVALARMLSYVIFEGKTYSDIAKIENISQGAVRTRIHRAKNEFEKALEQYAK